MNRPDDELTHIFAKDMARAEQARKRLLIGGTVLGAIGAAAIAAALIFGSLQGGSPEQSASDRPAAASVPVATQPPERTQKPVESKPQVNASKAAAKSVPKSQPSTQQVQIAIGEVGYEPAMVTVKHGVPVELTVGKGEGCAAGFLMPELGIQADNSSGPATVKLDDLEKGTYRFTCAMEMVEGRLIVE